MTIPPPYTQGKCLLCNTNPADLEGCICWFCSNGLTSREELVRMEERLGVDLSDIEADVDLAKWPGHFERVMQIYGKLLEKRLWEHLDKEWEDV